MVGDSIVKHLHRKPIANKTSRNNIILVTPFLELVIKPWNITHYITPDLVVVHTVTNNLQSVNSTEGFANERYALPRKEKGHQIAVFGILPRGDRFFNRAKDVNDCLEVQRKDHNVDFISHNNRNPRSYLN